MKLKDYFEQTTGTGLLSTADSDGKVDAAIYARPHVMDDGSLAFLMRDRLTHHNIQQNRFAVYLFIEAAAGHRGVRLYLEKTKEETDAALIQTMTRRWLSPEEDAAKGPKFLVYFKVEKMLTLIGSDTPTFELS